ncbi:hypothetical protein OC846_004671 [Tilletia horrida]|uniref:acylaminoacyl-peptidase n=1 Tax=Tilletia horrida TaxID=155126 RepID=A0AAN6GPB1_9BASI|nr:hypothetical protein OC846_004671 [Tilletia horrida]KAK0565173.1 hypothetical protein OC861_003908 [Tilletia horrida]
MTEKKVHPREDQSRSVLDDPILRDVYLPLAEIPVVSTATFAGESVAVVLSTRDHQANTWLKTRFEIGLPDSAPDGKHPLKSLGASIPPIPAKDDSVKAVWTSPASPHKVILRESTAASTSWKEASGKRRAVEFWKGHRCFKRVDVTKHHGAFNTDDTFGTLDVNKDRVLYSAERNLSAWEDSNDDLAVYDYRPGLGEKLSSKVRPTLFIVDLNDSSISELKLGADDPIDAPLPARSVFASDGVSIYTNVLSLTADGRRLGQVYCTNRPAAIHQIDGPAPSHRWDITVGDKTRLSPLKISAGPPCALKDSVVFLGVAEGGPHNGSQALYRATKQHGCTELVPVQNTPGPGGWPGLFNQVFPTEPRLNYKGRSLLVLSSTWHARRVPLLIDLDAKKPSFRDLAPSDPVTTHCRDRLEATSEGVDLRQDKLDGQPGAFSYSVLNTDGHSRFLAVRSRPNVPQQLVLGTLQDDDDDASGLPNVKWTILWRAIDDYKGEKLLEELQTVQSDVVSIEKAAPGVQSIVLRPPVDSSKAGELPPFILFPHGGPHSATTIDWSPMSAALALLGYTVALPNYSGSLGISQNFVTSLIGRCGTLDVDDCIATTQQMIDQKIASRDSLYITGGSHGGFLTAHLIKPPKSPSVPSFRAAVMRNPVIAAGQQAATSDIPDWCWEEFGERFDFENPPILKAGVFNKLESNSPIAHIDKIEAPVLLLIGLADQRVPYWNQGKVLYHAMKARNKTVRMLTFKDADHALDTLEAEAVSVLSTVRWFRQATC